MQYTWYNNKIIYGGFARSEQPKAYTWGRLKPYYQILLLKIFIINKNFVASSSGDNKQSRNIYFIIVQCITNKISYGGFARSEQPKAYAWGRLKPYYQILLLKIFIINKNFVASSSGDNKQSRNIYFIIVPVHSMKFKFKGKTNEDYRN